MRVSRPLKHIAYACGLFILINVMLYMRSEQLFPSGGSVQVGRQPVPARAAPVREVLVTGLSSPRLFMDNVLDKYNLRSLYPSGLWPYNSSDRLFQQLDFLSHLSRGLREVPSSMVQLSRSAPHHGDKIILVSSGVRLPLWHMKREIFITERCPINNCFLLDDPLSLPAGRFRPDAVIYRGAFNALKRLSENRTKDEIWVVYQLESPLHASMGKFHASQTPNWTATYRRGSTLSTPYEQFVPYPAAELYDKDGDGFGGEDFYGNVNIAAGKSKLMAWFATNCRTENERLTYVHELQRYLAVDVYGSCGSLKCPRHDATCTEMLKKDYKFYLAFENSNCREYITEKMFFNAMANDVVPIVMGAHPDDYQQVAPPHSYIHVDDFASPKELAQYLHKLDKNDTLYNEYFRWKGTGRFINTKFWCRLCAMLHAREQDNYVHWYKDIHEWWTSGACVGSPPPNKWVTWRGKQSPAKSKNTDVTPIEKTEHKPS